MSTEGIYNIQEGMETATTATGLQGTLGQRLNLSFSVLQLLIVILVIYALMYLQVFFCGLGRREKLTAPTGTLHSGNRRDDYGTSTTEFLIPGVEGMASTNYIGKIVNAPVPDQTPGQAGSLAYAVLNSDEFGCATIKEKEQQDRENAWMWIQQDTAKGGGQENAANRISDYLLSTQLRS